LPTVAPRARLTPISRVRSATIEAVTEYKPSAESSRPNVPNAANSSERKRGAKAGSTNGVVEALLHGSCVKQGQLGIDLGQDASHWRE
jgi:hypothetical protein